MKQQTEKKLYQKPELDVIEINLTDIISTSGGGCSAGPEDPVDVDGPETSKSFTTILP